MAVPTARMTNIMTNSVRLIITVPPPKYKEPKTGRKAAIRLDMHLAVRKCRTEGAAGRIRVARIEDWVRLVGSLLVASTGPDRRGPRPRLRICRIDPERAQHYFCTALGT
jgi:hypothetical protein